MRGGRKEWFRPAGLDIAVYDCPGFLFSSGGTAVLSALVRAPAVQALSPVSS